jgi:xanthosine utilization system XapX-like protein
MLDVFFGRLRCRAGDKIRGVLPNILEPLRRELRVAQPSAIVSDVAYVVIIVIVALIARIQVPTTTALLFALSLVIGTTIAQFVLAALWGAWFNRANAPDVVGHVDERLRAIFWAKIANKIVSTRSQRCSPIP